jgi:nitrate reductase gamma subunit
MPSTLRPFELFLYAGLPYVSLVILVLGSLYRWRTAPFTLSSLSSQFLENQQHFWSLVPFHYGIMTLFLGHLLAFAIPRSVLWWNGQPLRLYVLEIAALAFGLLAFVGLLGIVSRRWSNAKGRITTSRMDWVVYVLLLVQVITGLYVALFHRWGSSWFAAALSPYLWSLLRLNPDPSYVAGLPVLVKSHIVGAFLVFALVPFSRLIHAFLVPVPYLWRRPQVVRWYRRGGTAAAAGRG